MGQVNICLGIKCARVDTSGGAVIVELMEALKTGARELVNFMVAEEKPLKSMTKDCDAR